MADVHKLTVQESLNAMGPGGVWDVFAAQTYSGSSASDTKSNDVSEYHQLGIISTVDIYFSFSSDHNTLINVANDLKIEADTLVFLTIPRGLYRAEDKNPNKINFHHLSSTGSGVIKIVGV